MEGKIPKVSVVMCCYNHEEYVAEAIESVLAQTYQDFEFLVGNNGSTDRCGEIIEQYKDRVRIITLEKNDAVKCNRMLIEASQGEFITFIASDDYWYPNKLEEQMRAVDRFPKCNVFFTWAEITGKELCEVTDRTRFAQNNKSRHQWIHDMIMKGTLTDASSLLIKNDGRWQRYGDGTDRFRQLPDLMQYLNIVLEEDIYIVEKFLVKHRNHGGNISAPNEDTFIRTLNEEGYIIYDMWRRLNDEDFCKVFKEEGCVFGEKEDVMCQRILLYMRLAETKPGSGSFALGYIWSHFHDKGVSKLLEEKYQFTLHDLYEYEFKVGEGKYWYYVRQESIRREKKKDLLSIVKCIDKIVAYAKDGSVREELQKLVEVTIDTLMKIMGDDLLLQECVEKQTLMKQSVANDDVWFDMIRGLNILNEKIKTEYDLT
ncbi:MAG: glycosyltransferase family 2 protein [Lachnospiraceae bacterium]|nr:glycosyltransferase family 2 protein [Lachnospiraceae bacterium]MCM1239650.1 glycosyltransferase family 2 protein [Lachnospiraceae bacterium]